MSVNKKFFDDYLVLYFKYNTRYYHYYIVLYLPHFTKNATGISQLLWL